MRDEDRWIGEYQSVGPVEWPQGLRADIEAKLRRATRKLMFWVYMCPGNILVGVAIAALGYSTAAHPVTSAIGLALAGIGLLSFPVSLLLGNDARKLRSKAKAAWRCRLPEKFELGVHAEEELEAARGRGEDIAEDSFVRAIYIDPVSSLVLQVDDEPMRVLDPVKVKGVARPAGSSAFGEGPREHRLSEGELEELRKYVRSGRVSLLGLHAFYALLTVGFVLVWTSIILHWPSHGAGVGASVLISLLWVVKTLAVIGPERTRGRLLALLRRDVREGDCEVVEGRDAVRDLAPSASLDDDDDLPAVVRRLRESKVWWEIDGTPAAWRRY